MTEFCELNETLLLKQKPQNRDGKSAIHQDWLTEKLLSQRLMGTVTIVKRRVMSDRIVWNGNSPEATMAAAMVAVDHQERNSTESATTATSKGTRRQTVGRNKRMHRSVLRDTNPRLPPNMRTFLVTS